MGFPVGYSEMPKLVLHFLFLLGHLRRTLTWLLRFVGVDMDAATDWADAAASHYELGSCCCENSAEYLEEHLPAVRFEVLAAGECDGRLPERCAVCLGEFDGAAEVRRPRGCRHVFHRACLDRWAAHGQRTCPLCRAPLLPTPAPAMLLSLQFPAS